MALWKYKQHYAALRRHLTEKLISADSGHFLFEFFNDLMDNFQILTICSLRQVTSTLLFAGTSDLWLPWKRCIKLSCKMDLGTFFSANNTIKTIFTNKTCLVHAALLIK